mmetsp:Transcript_42620/g.96357  ORF Transcript_42620/g.96357 Transcript_42620/m.96357 type:complete len:317 (+) Transcript_42620:1959-2909(+)
MLCHQLTDHAESRGGLGHTLEKLVCARKVSHLGVFDHGFDPRILHVSKRLHVLSDELTLRNFPDPGLRVAVEVVAHSLGLLEKPRLCFLHVVGGRILRHVFLRLRLVEGAGLLQEGILEVRSVHLAPQLDKHPADRLQQRAGDHLALPLALDHVKHHVKQPVLDLRVAADLVAEDLQPAVVHRGLLLRDNVSAVHVHEDVADHDRGDLVLVPLVLQLLQEAILCGAMHLGRHGAQVRRDGLLEASVQLVAELVQDHVIRVAIELLKAQTACVLAVDLMDGVVERLPRLSGVLLVQLVELPLDDEPRAVARSHLCPP